MCRGQPNDPSATGLCVTPWCSMVKAERGLARTGSKAQHRMLMMETMGPRSRIWLSLARIQDHPLAHSAGRRMMAGWMDGFRVLSRQDGQAKAQGRQTSDTLCKGLLPGARANPGSDRSRPSAGYKPNGSKTVPCGRHRCQGPLSRAPPHHPQVVAGGNG